ATGGARLPVADSGKPRPDRAGRLCDSACDLRSNAHLSRARCDRDRSLCHLWPGQIGQASASPRQPGCLV
ncbi:MAG: hypothetical protein AVDCRST_MAG15-3147, partial [uncultured Rubellimicrobium sp.]